MATWTYRLDHDLGFAPNPFFGWCSLACCKSDIREHAKLNDFVVGMAGAGQRGLGRYFRKAIYWMKVEFDLTFDQYWNDARFKRKLPLMAGNKMEMVGDRTYRRAPEGKKWLQETSMHFIPGFPQKNGGHLKRDTKVDRVLVGGRFTYWGNNGPLISEHLLPLFPNPRGSKKDHDPALLAELHNLLEVHKPKGLAGNPADWDNPKYFSR